MIIPKDIAEPAITLSDNLFDLKGLSAYSALGVGTLRDYIRTGLLPCFKLRGKVLVRRSEFDRWLEGYRANKEQDVNRMVDDVMDSLKKL